jgi:hypothetical protein
VIDPDPCALADTAAERVIRGTAGCALPIDPIAIALANRIEVFAKPARDRGVSGMLIRVGQEYAIAYATDIDNEAFQRFSVGHELGHYFLPAHPEGVLNAEGIHESRAGYQTEDRYEREADAFSAALLMPRHLFVAALKQTDTGFAAIETLAALCKTSWHATAIRYAQCSADPVAVVVTVGGRIDHWVMSDELRELDRINWLRKHEAVPRGTATFEFNQRAENVRTCARVDGTCNLRDWFGGPFDIEVSEDVVGLGSYGRTLTLLYDIALPDEEERKEEESLRDSWALRFRR